jgi:hypothetical protein
MAGLSTIRKAIAFIFFSIVAVIFIDSCKKDSAAISKPPPDKTPALEITITSVRPLTGKQGDTVFIIGTNFNLNPALDTVKFNGISAQVHTANTDSLIVTVPEASTTGRITVNGVSATGPDFTVLQHDSADIYICGSAFFGHGAAQYLKNGFPVILSDGTKNESTCGIVVSGSDLSGR